MTASVSGGCAEQPMPVDRAHRNDPHAVVAADRDLDGVAGLPPPQRLVELLLRGHGDAVDADNLVAHLEARRAGRARLVEAVDDDAPGLGGRVEAEPGP